MLNPAAGYCGAGMTTAAVIYERWLLESHCLGSADREGQQHRLAEF